MPASRSGFTLLEICLALAIGLLLILVAVPSISGLLAEQRLKKSFDRLEQLVAAARTQSTQEQSPALLVWDRAGIVLKPADARTPGPRLDFTDGESYEIQRTGALTKDPAREWTFWRNGTCEPVVIRYQGQAGHWQVAYNPLTTRARFEESATR